MSNSENNHQPYDIIVIGGGATGLGVALEAVTRGYTTILFEANDFGSGTSSKSTKLVHGGIRYLANLDFALVKEGLAERHIFLKNAPHLAKAQSYLIPFYSFYDKFKYFIGIKLYDFLSGTRKINKSCFLNKQQTIKIAPQLNPKNLKGGGIYYDGQFDDARMLITLLKTFTANGGVAINYHEIINLIKNNENKVIGVEVKDKLNDHIFKVYAKVVINATGVLTDTLLDIDEPTIKHNHVAASQGTHLVFDKSIFDSLHTLVIPKTTDNRILFVLPWHNKIIVGTTDIAITKATIEVSATKEEVNFILETLNQYTNKIITHNDIKSIFAGIRPLVKPTAKTDSAKISRKHEILYSQSGIISIVGGKWTIYRLMGEDTINFAIENKLLAKKQLSITQSLPLFGYTTNNIAYPLSVYGTEAEKINQIQKEINNTEKLHPNLPYYAAEVVYHVRHEMAKTVEDVLARRTRALFLDAKSAIEATEKVANIMAQELNKDKNWIALQISKFNKYAKNYIAT